ncbi:transcription factor IIb, putative [Plasmodium vivax]|uniref:Transcription factor IIb, putative n=1 Tax=Plasmodium vivax TaxID=5855 RepID=A0A1G4HEH8_PLAVI|nr:transcription factor IIb, putative [Plasmodium vivax]
MYRNKFQPNILSLLLSAGSKPLDLWKTKTKKGCVRKVLDDTIKLSAIEIVSENTSDSYIYTAPEKFSSLGISLPFIVLIVKNMNKYFSFRISIMDDKRCRRTFRISNFQVSRMAAWLIAQEQRHGPLHTSSGMVHFTYTPACSPTHPLTPPTTAYPPDGDEALQQVVHHADDPERGLEHHSNKSAGVHAEGLPNEVPGDHRDANKRQHKNQVHLLLRQAIQ